jgi:hypothetical protein
VPFGFSSPKSGTTGAASILRRPGPVLGFRMPVDRDIGDIGQQLGCPILAFCLFKQRRRLVDEAGGVGLGAR